MMIMRSVAVVLLFSAACSVVPHVSSTPAASASPAVATSDAGERAAIEAVLRQLTEAQKNYDAAAMERVLAPDYVEVSPDGAVDERAKVLGFYTPERKKAAGVELTSYSITELTTRIYDNTAVAVALLPFTMVNSPGAPPTTHAFRCTYVLVRNEGRWLVASAQATLVRQPDPAAS